MKSKISLIAYTDGSASVAGKMAGYGGFGTFFYKHLNGKPKGFALGFKQTKTGRMEISALYYAIASLPKTYKEEVSLTVYSDSEYVVKSFTEGRLDKWVRNGWQNSSGEVKNKDMWSEILLALGNRKYLTLEMKHIYSHQVEREKDPIKKAALMKNLHIIGNIMADELAAYKEFDSYLDSDKLIK